MPPLKLNPKLLEQIHGAPGKRFVKKPFWIFGSPVVFMEQKDPATGVKTIHAFKVQKGAPGSPNAAWHVPLAQYNADGVKIGKAKVAHAAAHAAIEQMQEMKLGTQQPQKPVGKLPEPAKGGTGKPAQQAPGKPPKKP